MSTTTIKVHSAVRDRLAAVAERDFNGSSLGEAFDRVLTQYETVQRQREVLDGYARLQADPDAWQDYVNEVEDWAELGAETMRQADE
jgi:hypothetical protein